MVPWFGRTGTNFHIFHLCCHTLAICQQMEKKIQWRSILVVSLLSILSCLSTAVILTHEMMDRRPSWIILHPSAILPLFHAHVNLTHTQPVCQRPQPQLFTEKSLPKSFLLPSSLRDLHDAELTGDPWRSKHMALLHDSHSHRSRVIWKNHWRPSGKPCQEPKKNIWSTEDKKLDGHSTICSQAGEYQSKRTAKLQQSWDQESPELS